MQYDGSCNSGEREGCKLFGELSREAVVHRIHQVVDGANAANAEPHHHAALLAGCASPYQPGPHNQWPHDEKQQRHKPQRFRRQVLCR